ncbi:putative ATPase [Paenibacillus cellulosilyticus]|uniref:Putative ATPase n=1 Tax=Paenibacillus cellulosilyticus TaxID=375489 RepID=A0A2V2YV64_9BACL|nr:AAA family ATPase [Paenibacillus cellulosilyticus]PWW05183.1 putative ATPase [Paenibacillus cellulosilyticus]QKS43511.1 AAA family ATPase [Paenibacillus cellulosilyticus]
MMYGLMPFLRQVELDRQRIPSFDGYPFNLEVVKQLRTLSFHPKVTYLVGDNGMGKSTLMEAIAVAWGFNPEGGSMNFTFSTKASHSELYDYIRLVRGTRKPKDGFFFRAESYYNLATEIDALDREMSFGPPLTASYGGKSLHEQSHGESFFATFLYRFGGRGLYILDEPEAALSPLRQLSMLARIHELVEKGSQFIIATHSPILMAYPEATIYNLSPDGIEEKDLEETEHFIIMKQFMNNREKMIAELMSGDDEE